jgi:hypothetical protein
MTSDKAKRELDEDCSIERVKAVIGGNMGLAKLDDAMRRAVPLSERNEISPLALSLVGTLHRGADAGWTLTQQRKHYLDNVGWSGEQVAKWDAAIGQLRRHNLMPSNLHD